VLLLLVLVLVMVMGLVLFVSVFALFVFVVPALAHDINTVDEIKVVMSKPANIDEKTTYTLFLWDKLFITFFTCKFYLGESEK
jgi:ABC-type nickel/cobalt efflux system permease component RcnA